MKVKEFGLGTCTKLTLKVPEKLQLYGLYVYYVPCGAYLRLWHVKS